MICQFCHTPVGVPGKTVHRICDEHWSQFVLVVWTPCGVCGKEWPHPGVLSSSPTCDHCVQDLKKNLIKLRRSLITAEKQEGWRDHSQEIEQDHYRRLEKPLKGGRCVTPAATPTPPRLVRPRHGH